MESIVFIDRSWHGLRKIRFANAKRPPRVRRPLFKDPKVGSERNIVVHVVEARRRLGRSLARRRRRSARCRGGCAGGVAAATTAALRVAATAAAALRITAVVLRTARRAALA